MKSLRLVFLLFICLKSVESLSQVGVTSYSIYALGINSSQKNRLSGELKMFLNRPLENVLMEIDGFYNFKPAEYHRFSLGVGFNIGPFMEGDNIYAITIPVEIEVFPFKENKKVTFLFELAPEINEGDPNIRWLWGIRYSFGKSSD